jgi:dimethylamine monooxygenase subunit A
VRPLPPRRTDLPFEAGAYRMQMGLTAIRPDALFEIDERYPAEMHERRALLDGRRDEVFAATPGSAAARRETLDLVAGLLPPDWFPRDGGRLRNRLTGEDWDLADPALDPLELAGRLVQEDLCLLDPSGGAPVLAAAVLCFPSRWRLSEKIGRPLLDVHEHVPGYAQKLGRPVDRFIAHLRATPACRFNWSVVDDGALFQPGGKHRTALDPTITPEVVPERLHLRVERQTLSLLPASGFALFTIRVFSTPLGAAVADSATAARLAEAVRALPDAMAAYKSLPPYREALLRWLSTR